MDVWFSLILGGFGLLIFVLYIVLLDGQKRMHDEAVRRVKLFEQPTETLGKLVDKH